MYSHPHITIISGTNRRGSNSRRVADHLAKIYANLGVPAAVLDLAEISPSAYTPDAYDAIPQVARAFTDMVLASAGLHLVVPEYNGSFPGMLKAFIDLLEFPVAFDGRAVAFVGVAAGEWGGLRPVEQLQEIFAYRNALQFPKRVFIREVEDKFNPEGKLSDADIVERLTAQAAEFAEFARLPKLLGERLGVIRATSHD
jgi:chromate reductase